MIVVKLHLRPDPELLLRGKLKKGLNPAARGPGDGVRYLCRSDLVAFFFLGFILFTLRLAAWLFCVSRAPISVEGTRLWHTRITRVAGCDARSLILSLRTYSSTKVGRCRDMPTERLTYVIVCVCGGLASRAALDLKSSQPGERKKVLS